MSVSSSKLFASVVVTAVSTATAVELYRAGRKPEPPRPPLPVNTVTAVAAPCPALLVDEPVSGEASVWDRFFPADRETFARMAAEELRELPPFGPLNLALRMAATQVPRPVRPLVLVRTAE